MSRTVKVRRGMSFIIIGIILALASAIGVFALLAFTQPSGTAEVTRTPVVIAIQPISERQEITAEQIAITNWPVLSDFPLPPGVFSDPKDVVGRFSLVPIGQGQPLLATMVIDKAQAKENSSNASFILEKGTVAVALPLSSLSSVGNAIQPGDRVNLIATFSTQAPSSNQQPSDASTNTADSTTATHVTLQNLLILQVGAWPSAQAKDSGNSGGGGVVTLQATPQEAEILKYIETKAAQWAFALRPANDTELSKTLPVTFDYINKTFGFFPAIR